MMMTMKRRTTTTRTTTITRVSELWNLIETWGFHENIKDIESINLNDGDNNGEHKLILSTSLELRLEAT